jgi:hypothetical protein
LSVREERDSKRKEIPEEKRDTRREKKILESKVET